MIGCFGEWVPLLRIVVICIALAYLLFVTVEHFLPTGGEKRRLSPYIIIKMVSIISLCYNDIHIILSACDCGIVTSLSALLRMYFEPIRFSHLTSDLTSKFCLFDFIFKIDEEAQGELFCDIVVLFFWMIFCLRKLVVYFLCNSFKLSKLSKISEINFVVMFFFWFNMEGGFLNLLKTEFLAHYIIFMIKGVYGWAKEEIQDEDDDEDDSIGLTKHVKSGVGKLKEKTKRD